MLTATNGPSAFRSCPSSSVRGLAWSGLGKYFASRSSTSLTPSSLVAELATIGETAIFEFNVNQESTLDFFVADFGNATTGRDGWSGNKIFDFPFEFESNPHTFTMFYTTTDDQFRNTSIEIYFTVERELINLP